MIQRVRGEQLVRLADDLGLPAPTLDPQPSSLTKQRWVAALENDEEHRVQLASAAVQSLDEGSHREFLHGIALQLRCANVKSLVFPTDFIRLCEYADRAWPIPDEVIAARLDRLEATYGPRRRKLEANRSRMVAANNPHGAARRTPAVALRDARRDLAERVTSRLHADLARNLPGVVRWSVDVNGTAATVQCWRGSVWRIASAAAGRRIESVDTWARREGWAVSDGRGIWQRWPSDAKAVGSLFAQLGIQLHETVDTDDLHIALDLSEVTEPWLCRSEDVFGCPTAKDDETDWGAAAGRAVEALAGCLPAPTEQAGRTEFTWLGHRLCEPCSPDEAIALDFGMAFADGLELVSGIDQMIPLLATSSERVWLSSAQALRILESEAIPDKWLGSLRLPFPIVTFILERPFVIPTKELKRIPLSGDGPAWRRSMNDLSEGAAVYAVTCTADSDGAWLPSIVVHLVKVRRRRAVGVLSVPGSTRSMIGQMAMKLGTAFAEHRPLMPSVSATGRAAQGKALSQQVHFRVVQSSRDGRGEQLEGRRPAPHSRRGHWRRQRVGPRDNWRYEVRWIPPAWVGADHELPSDHIYVVPLGAAP